MPDKKISPKRKKLLMLLPLFLLPAGIIFYLIFYLVHTKGPTEDVKVTLGAFNEKLPGPNLPTREKNKFELYMEAARDSIKKKAAMSQDPYSVSDTPANENFSLKAVSVFDRNSELSQINKKSGQNLSPDKTVENANEHLKKIYEAINNVNAAKPNNASDIHQQIESAHVDPSAARIEKLIETSRQYDSETDPKITQISGMLDKIYAIKTYNKDSGRLQRQDNVYTNNLLPVTTSIHDVDVDAKDYGGITGPPRGNAFYGWSDESDTISSNSETILAVTYDNQVVHSGSNIRIRILQDIYLGSNKISKGTFLTGVCSLESERIKIMLTSINCNNQIYPIHLSVFDLDGLEGIPAPGSMSRDAAKEGLSQGIGTMGMTSLDPSLAAQATSGAIETAKNLLSRKAKLIQAIVKADHKILLKRS